MTLEAVDNGINPYAAPKARVEAPAVLSAVQPVFFQVGILKLAVMSIVTLGLYQLYWFYKNWKCVERHGEEVNAPVRAFFYPLTSYWLFRRIRDRAATAGGDPQVEAGAMAIMLAVFTAFGSLSGLACLFSFFNVLPLLHVQAAVNKLNRKLTPGVDENSRLRGWNIVALAVGVPFLVLGVIGSFMEP